MADVIVVSDFNAELVSRYISSDRTSPVVSAESASYGSIIEALSNVQLGSDLTSLFVWTRPEGISPSFAGLIRGEPVAIESTSDEVGSFANLLINTAGRFRTLFVVNWTRTEAGRGSGLLDWTEGGQARSLARMNLQLADLLEGYSNIRILDSQRWLDIARPPRDARYWYAMKFPFTKAVAQAAARDVKAALRAFSGQSRKLIVLDLDNTLWGGVIGETGWEGIRLGGHDAIGEAYVDFQRTLKALSAHGIALAVVSKNTEAVALEAFDLHPEMVLGRSNIAGWRINWEDKAANMQALVEELNLGMQSVVFIDDSPIERGRVSEAFPEVLVPDWPTDPTRFADALRQLDCFDQSALTDDDLRRNTNYVADRQRSASRTPTESLDDWLKGLDVRVTIEPVGKATLARAVQLANKTNQFNLATRRFTEVELSKWLADASGRETYTINVCDRFGDIGLTAVISWEQHNENLEIVDFLLSCRAMGRQVEVLMAHFAVEAARSHGLNGVTARLISTPRNGPCQEFWKLSNFNESEPNLFTWNVSTPYPKPPFIEAIVKTSS